MYKNILAAVDGSKESLKAFDKAMVIAKENDAKLMITHVVDIHAFSIVGETFPQSFFVDAASFANELLSGLEQRAKEAGLTNIEVILEHGSPKMEIAKNIAVKHSADLIVCGATGLHGVERVMIGSVAERIVRYAKCDVLVVRYK